MRSIELHVDGIPRPQGSKTCICRGGNPIMFESAEGLGPWRTKVAQAARPIKVTWTRQTPLMVELIFTMPATKTRPHGWAPTELDIDKLTRAVLDGLTFDKRDRGVLPDDAQVCRLIVDKVHGPHPGVAIRVSDVPPAYDALPLTN